MKFPVTFILQSPDNSLPRSLQIRPLGIRFTSLEKGVSILKMDDNDVFISHQDTSLAQLIEWCGEQGIKCVHKGKNTFAQIMSEKQYVIFKLRWL